MSPIRPSRSKRFDCIEDSRGFCTDFFRWYNEEHDHGALEPLTPADVHYGGADAARPTSLKGMRR